MTPRSPRRDRPAGRSERPGALARRGGPQAAPDGLLPRLLPAAQPLLCAVFLGLGRVAAAAAALRRRRVDINLLMLVAAAGAAFLGAWSEGGVLLFLFSLSNALEFYVKIGRAHV